MADALRGLASQQRPSKVHIPGLLDGLSNINGLADSLLNEREARLTIISQNG